MNSLVLEAAEAVGGNWLLSHIVFCGLRRGVRRGVSLDPTGAVPPCSTRNSKVGKCAAFQLWTATVFLVFSKVHFGFF